MTQAPSLPTPYGWLKANGYFERGAELATKTAKEAEDAIPLYTSPVFNCTEAAREILENVQYYPDWERDVILEDIESILKRHCTHKSP